MIGIYFVNTSKTSKSSKNLDFFDFPVVASKLAVQHKKKSRASGFLYFSLFSFHSSLFSNSHARLFQRKYKREERKEKVAFLPLVEKH